MKKMLKQFKGFKGEEMGQGLIEYGLVMSLISIIVLVVLASLGSGVYRSFDDVSNEYSKVLKEGDYFLHYGKLSEKGMENAKKYEMAILEPISVSSEEVKRLEKSGTVTYGYQSPLAVEKANPEKIAMMHEDDYLYLSNGVKRKNKHFDYYYGDIRSDRYRELLKYFLEKDIKENGFSGVYFDAIEDIEGFRDDPELQKELYDGYMSFFKELNDEYPEISIIQNRALNFYMNGSANYIDAMMFENLDYNEFKHAEEGSFYANLIRSLKEAEKNSDSVIIVMSYHDAEENYDFAKENGWSYYHFIKNKNFERVDPFYSLHKR